MTPETRIRFADTVRARLGPERGFLFDERSGRVYSLNTSAAFVAARIAQALSAADIVRAVVEAFEVDEAVARRDFDRLVAQLVAEGLARVEGEPDG